jgi:hypothetical protein
MAMLENEFADFTNHDCKHQVKTMRDVRDYSGWPFRRSGRMMTE